MVWSGEQVLALAPDPGSVAAARKLSEPGPWSETGVDLSDGRAAVWGECAGGGRNPYRAVVDLTGPAYKCSCPSRKFPCKHALGLLLRWSAGQVAAGTPPEWARTWLDGRAQRAAAPAPAPKAAPDPRAAEQRAERRDARVAAGVDELDRWLTDQVRTGLTGIRQGGYGYVESVAARMVDAQAPGLATALRRLPGIAAGRADWTGALLEELGLLRLTVAGHRNLDRLPPELAACVRREVGQPVSREDVLAGPPVADRWQVVGRRDDEQDRFTVRRIWLRGERTDAAALVLSFAAAGQALDASLLPGTSVDADLHFYPGAVPLRAVVGDRRGTPRPVEHLRGGSLADAAAGFAAAVAADPWTRTWPVVVAGLTPVAGDEQWQARDGAGGRVRLLSPTYVLLAVSGGHPVTVAGEYTVAGLRPLTVLDPDPARPAGTGRLVPL
jgi:SWIM zinc finger